MRHTHRVASALLAFLCAGCATVDPQLEQHRRQAAAHVYERPLPEVWTHVRALLDAEGYVLKEEAGAFVVITDFRELLDGADAVSIWRQYVVKGHALDAEHTVIRIYRHELSAYAEMVDNSHGHQMVMSGEANRGDFNPKHNGAIRFSKRNPSTVRRDLTMEWELMRRVEWLAARSADAGQ